VTTPRTAETELRPTNRRLESFSDGVFAIVVTIMILEIHVPESLAFRDDPIALRHVGALIGTYAVSFLIIVNLWISHHYLILTLARPAKSTIWFNSLLLFCVTLLPVSTLFLGIHPGSSRAAAAYGLVAALCTASFMLLRRHAMRRTHNEVHREIHRRVLRRTWVFLAIYAASVPLAFVSPWLAWACFVAILPPMLLLPIIRAPTHGNEMPEDRALEHSCP